MHIERIAAGQLTGNVLAKMTPSHQHARPISGTFTVQPTDVQSLKL